MRVLFIRPNMSDTRASDAMEPLVFAILAGQTPPEDEVVLVDERLESIPWHEPADLVALTVETFTARHAYQIAARFRQRGVPVVMGGYHPTLLPAEAGQYADAVVVGDAESIWPQVIRDARDGCLRPVYRQPEPSALAGFKPDRAIFRGKRYAPLALVQYGRGCRYECDFCAVSVFFNKTHFCRPVAEVIREIEAQERRLHFFVDDNILANFEAAKALCREMIPLKVHWVSQASIDMTQDRELMALPVKSGCLGHVIGFESINVQNLHSMKKVSNLIGGFKDYKPQLEILRDYGLQTWAAFTLGHDGDTPASIEATLEFALDNKFAFAAFNVLMPYPTTPLYRRLKAEGRLLYDDQWWLHPDYRFNYAAFLPKLMSPEELTEAAYRARSSFNSLGSIIRRAFDLKTNMRSLRRFGAYVAYNPLFRQEVFKKQGLKLGLR